MARIEIIPVGEQDFASVTVDEHGRVSGEPVFYGSGREQVPVALLVVRANGDEVRRYVLRISGSELRLSLQERSNPVRPAYEVPADELKSTTTTSTPKQTKG